jgi:hypothetical protein
VVVFRCGSTRPNLCITDCDSYDRISRTAITRRNRRSTDGIGIQRSHRARRRRVLRCCRNGSLQSLLTGHLHEANLLNRGTNHDQAIDPSL